MENTEIVNVKKENLKELYNKVKNSEAVLFTPLTAITEKEMVSLLDWINENKIPNFSIIDL